MLRPIESQLCGHCVMNYFGISLLSLTRGGGGGGGGTHGVLTPNFGRYVPRQNEKWASAPERAPGRAWNCVGSGTSLSRFELENGGLRNELEPFWAWKCESPERAWSVLSVKMQISERPRTRGASERFAFGLSRSWEAMNGLKLKKFWKWWSPERQYPPKKM